MVYNSLTTYCICTEENHYEYIHHMSRALIYWLCGDRVCGHCTHWNTSKFVLYKVMCGMYWFAECHLFYETWSAVLNLLGKGLCGLGVMWRCNLILED